MSTITHRRNLVEHTQARTLQPPPQSLAGRCRRSLGYGLAALTALAALPAAAQHPLVERVSVATDGTQGNSESNNAAISADGRYIAFESTASNLVPNDTNGQRDIFVRDRQLGTTTRISLNSNGTQSNQASTAPSISGDGQRIVFRGYHLLPTVNSFAYNCYLFDRSSGTPVYSLLDVRNDGSASTSCCYAPSIDRAGTRVAFVSPNSGLLPPGTDTNGFDDVFVRELAAGTIRRVNLGPAAVQGNGHASQSRLSGDGSQVIYASVATNLVGGDSNGRRDIFLSDMNGNTRRVSLGDSQLQTDGDSGQVAALNDHGRLIAFSVKSSNLPNWNPTAVSVLYARAPACDRTVAMSGNPVGSQLSAGEEADFSANGRWLAFWSADPLSGAEAPNGGVFVRDLRHGSIALLSRRPDGVTSSVPNNRHVRISADGRGIVWHSFANDLVPGDSNLSWDVFYVDNPLWDDTLFYNGFECGV